MGGLTLGKDGNTKDITIAAATSIAGPITIYGGAITINAALTATGTNTITLKGSGNVTDGASGYVVASNLLLLGGNVTLDNSTNNAIGTLAASGVSGLTYVNNTDLAIGSVTLGATPYNGLSATGVVSVKTPGNLTISQNVETTSTSATASAPALLLAAGSASAIGSVTYNIIFSGSPTFTIGTGGIADFYSGGMDESTGLHAYITAKTT